MVSEPKFGGLTIKAPLLHFNKKVKVCWCRIWQIRGQRHRDFQYRRVSCRVSLDASPPSPSMGRFPKFKEYQLVPCRRRPFIKYLKLKNSGALSWVRWGGGGSRVCKSSAWNKQAETLQKMDEEMERDSNGDYDHSWAGSSHEQGGVIKTRVVCQVEGSQNPAEVLLAQ